MPPLPVVAFRLAYNKSLLRTRDAVPPRTLQAYEAACARFESAVVLDGADIIRVRAALECDVRAHGAKGRAIVADIPLLGLRKNMRLEPTIEHPDVSDIDTATGPYTAVFLDSTAQSATRHRNPLFYTRSMITPESTAIDWLHCLSLGCVQHFLAYFYWAMFGANAWSVTDARVPLSISALREELFTWYANESRAGRQHMRVQQITLTKFGSSTRPDFRFHGAETNGLLEFSLHLVGQRGGALKTT